ncbi:MAG: acyloxyacyl hydrolase [Desulfobacteraceae bacterium]|jgi:hypothetical protein
MCHYTSIGGLVLSLLANSIFWHVAAHSDQDADRFVSLYVGRYSDTVLVKNLQFDHEFEGAYISVLSLGTCLAQYRRFLNLEIEGQMGMHSGSQHYQEINAAVVLRWLVFPWDRYLNTSFAFGNGLSYATADPVLEIEKAKRGQTAQWLYYILVEWAFSLQGHPNWEIFWRTHHRSGIYGRLADDNAGSNYIGLGLRRRF